MTSGLFLRLIFQEEEHVHKRNLTNSTTKGNVSPKNHHNHDNSYGYDPLEVTDRSYSHVKKVIKKTATVKAFSCLVARHVVVVLGTETPRYHQAK